MRLLPIFEGRTSKQMCRLWFYRLCNKISSACTLETTQSVYKCTMRPAAHFTKSRSDQVTDETICCAPQRVNGQRLFVINKSTKPAMTMPGATYIQQPWRWCGLCRGTHLSAWAMLLFLQSQKTCGYLQWLQQQHACVQAASTLFCDAVRATHLIGDTN